MSEQLASSYAASRLLGRDRQTIERDVQHLAPDEYRIGRPHWRVDRIAAALAMTPQERVRSGRYRDQFSLGRNKALDGLRLLVEKQIMLIAAEPSRDRRRQMAVELAPKLAEYHALFLGIGRSLGVAADNALGTQSDLVWSEWLDELSEAAQWPRDEGFGIAMIEAAWPDADEDE